MDGRSSHARQFYSIECNSILRKLSGTAYTYRHTEMQLPVYIALDKSVASAEPVSLAHSPQCAHPSHPISIFHRTEWMSSTASPNKQSHQMYVTFIRVFVLGIMRKFLTIYLYIYCLLPCVILYAHERSNSIICLSVKYRFARR